MTGLLPRGLIIILVGTAHFMPSTLLSIVLEQI